MRSPHWLSPQWVGGFFSRDRIYGLSIHLDVVLLSFVVGSSSVGNFQTNFRGKEGELRTFLHSHLETPLPKDLIKMQVLIQQAGWDPGFYSSHSVW